MTAESASEPSPQAGNMNSDLPPALAESSPSSAQVQIASWLVSVSPKALDTTLAKGRAAE